MAPQLDVEPRELRETAAYLEQEILPIVADYTSTIRIAPAVGNAQFFPRPSRVDQAGEQGFSGLQESVTQAVEMLYALALALENELEVPPVLLELVRPYVEAFREQAISEEEYAAEEDVSEEDVSEEDVAKEPPDEEDDSGKGAGDKE